VADAAQYTILGLIAARADGTHGYQLKIDFDALYGEFWSLNYGQLYRTLDRLERAGFIEGTEEVQSGRPSRKVYRITTTGRQSLDDWLMLPPSEDPRPLRDELSVKLLFLTEPHRKATLALIRSQRTVYLQHLARLTKRRTVLEESGQEMFVTNLLLLQADMRVRTDLAWLDLVEKALLERGATTASPSSSLKTTPPARPRGSGFR
jgi:DNA-binding PadR family transcriptional regulator